MLAENVVEEISLTLAELARGSNLDRAALMAGGAIPLLVGALQRHGSLARNPACVALVAVAADIDVNHAAIVAAGAVPLLIAALPRDPQTGLHEFSYLARSCVTAMHTLSKNAVSATAIAAGGGVPRLLSLLSQPGFDDNIRTPAVITAVQETLRAVAPHASGDERALIEAALGAAAPGVGGGLGMCVGKVGMC